MKQLKEHFNGNELTEFFQNKMIEEGVIGDFFKKTYNYLKGKIAKIGNLFVSLFNGKPLPVMLPITSQLALKNGKIADSKCMHWMGNSEDKKYSGVDTTGNELLSSRISTIEMWKKAAVNIGVRESLEKGKTADEIFEVLKLASDDNQILNVDDDRLEKLVRIAIRRGSQGTPLLIWGAPGVGKTAIINRVRKEIQSKDSRLLDMQLSFKEHDDFFLPSYNVDKTLATDVPKSYLPVWEDKPGMTDEERKAADEACGRGVIFLDELSRAKPQVQNVCLKLVQERKLGDTYKLGSGWVVIAASNRIEDDIDSQHSLGAALANRFQQVNYTPTCKSWRKWADTQKLMNQHVLDWLEQNEKYFYYHDNDETTLYASPRSWEAACKSMADMLYTSYEEGFDLFDLSDDDILAAIQMNVGLAPARAFLDYVRLARTINIEDLKLALTKPEKAPLPKKVNGEYRADLVYIITTTILSFVTEMPSPETFKNLCIYFARLKNESAAGKFWPYINRKFPDLGYHFGEGEEGEDEFDDAYVEGLRIFQEAYPEWEKADMDYRR